jgi:hypothetical protein
MPLSSKVVKDFIESDGSTKEALAFYFTNGAKEQLCELKNFFKQQDELEVVKLAISFLQKVREQKELEQKKHVVENL